MLVRMSRADFALMKLNARYTFVTQTVGGETVLRLVSKTSALVQTLSQGLRSVGLVPATGYAEDSSGTGRAPSGWINFNTKVAANAPIQVWRP